MLSSMLAVVLLAYCFGHGLITSEPLYLRASLAFSLSHAMGLASGLWVLLHIRRAHIVFRIAITLAVAVLASGLLYWLLMLGTGVTLLHQYNSLVAYAIAASGLSVWVRPMQNPPLLEVDFGKRRRLISPHDIVAVTAAKNYAEVLVRGEDQAGLMRSTLSDLERTLQSPGSTILRVHRSHLVATAAITAIHSRSRGALEVTVDDRHTLPVSPRYADAIRRACTLVPATVNSSHSHTVESGDSAA